MYKIATSSICKNELVHLDRFYKALKDEVDYITILDTGSTDGTWEALQELAKNDPKVIIKQEVIKPWRFDKARERAWDLVPEDTEIYVSIDLDETFDPGFGNTLRENWRDDVLEAKYLFYSHPMQDPNDSYAFVYSKILKNDRSVYHWEFPVHEWPVWKDYETVPTEHSLILTDKIKLRHHQIGKESRSDMYFNLLKLREKEYPKDEMAKCYLAREYFTRGDYNQVIKWADRALNIKNPRFLTINEQVFMYYLKGCSYLRLGQKERAYKILRQGIDKDPTYRDNYFILACGYMYDKRYNDAADILVEMREKSYRKYIWTEVNDEWGANVERMALDCLNCIKAINNGGRIE